MVARDTPNNINKILAHIAVIKAVFFGLEAVLVKYNHIAIGDLITLERLRRAQRAKVENPAFALFGFCVKIIYVLSLLHKIIKGEGIPPALENFQHTAFFGYKILFEHFNIVLKRAYPERLLTVLKIPGDCPRLALCGFACVADSINKIV